MKKSVFTPLVESSQEINSGITNDEGRLLTIPTVTMTATRPVLAGIVAKKLLKGERPVTPLVAWCFATDMEGAPGRLIDKLLPDSGLGTSPIGAKADIVADTAALIIVGSSALVAPRMPVLSRLAVATTFGHEGFKATWALNKNRIWKNAGGEGNLYLKPSVEGKCSMAEKMTSIGLAVLSSDFDEQIYRQPIAAAAMAFAVIGTARGEQERQHYEGQANDLISALEHNLPQV